MVGIKPKNKNKKKRKERKKAPKSAVTKMQKVCLWICNNAIASSEGKVKLFSAQSSFIQA